MQHIGISLPSNPSMELQELEFIDGISVTPPGRPHHHWSQLSVQDKDRVRGADPNGGRCLITNSICINYCHCVPKHMMSKRAILDRLEWAWNMKRYTLNLNTHKNIFLGSSDFHGYFDSKKWLLLPEDSIMDRFYNSLTFVGSGNYARRASFPELHEKIFFYTFVAFPVMKEESILITRQDDVIDDAAGEDASNLVINLKYPYRTLPRLKSHLRPEFAIFNAGIKLATLRGDLDQLGKIFEEYPSLVKVEKLYNAWIQKLPNDALNDRSYVDPDEELVPSSEDGSDNSKDGNYRSRTKSGHIGEDGFNLHLRPRTRSVAAAERGRGMAKSRKAPAKRKVLSESSAHNQQLLSEATLSRINQQFGESVWTCDNIRDWSHWKAFPKKRKLFSSLSDL